VASECGRAGGREGMIKQKGGRRKGQRKFKRDGDLTLGKQKGQQERLYKRDGETQFDIAASNRA
jgi:hypothetical protein